MAKNTTYVSEATQFIREMLKNNPELTEGQRKARATWWDKTLDREAQRRYQQSKVPQAGYAYFDLPHQAPTKPD